MADVVEVLRETAVKHVLTCYTGAVMCGPDEGDYICGWSHDSTNEQEQIDAWAAHLAEQQVAALVGAGLADVTLRAP